MSKPLTTVEKKAIREKRESEMLKRMSQPPRTWEEKQSERLEKRADRLLGPKVPEKKRYNNKPKQVSKDTMSVNGVIITDKEKIAKLEQLLHHPTHK